jgi:hypothetical protein
MALSTRGRGAHSAPSGVTTRLRPPRFLNVNGMWTVIVSPSAETVARVMRLPSAAHDCSHEPGEPVRPQPDLDAVHPDVDPLDQQLHDPRLLGREQLVPQGIELEQRLARRVVGDFVLLRAGCAPRANDDLRLPEDAAQLIDDRGLYLRRRHAANRARVWPTLQHILTDVVAVEPVALPRVRRRHSGAGRAENQTLQQRRRLRAGPSRTGAGVLGEDCVDLVPQVLIDDRRVLARMSGALVHREPEVGLVVEQLVEVALVDELAALGADSLGPQLARQHRRRADLDEPLEYAAHDGGVGVDHDQFAIPDRA